VGYSSPLLHMRRKISPIQSKQKYCSATCRAKGVYAKRKHELAKAQQLPSITEQLSRSEERVKHLEAQLKDRKEENEALRAAIDQSVAQPTPSRYHIALRRCP
jgi:hypothetical protein